MNLIDQQNVLVIDVTYNCNAQCRYCRWGNRSTPGRVNLADEHIYIPADTLLQLQTERVVFSGGEPLLRKDLEKLISYYRQIECVESVVVITNGFMLHPKRLGALVCAGLTGLSFSIDSFDYDIAFATRSYTRTQTDKMRQNFENACSLKNEYGLEIGINTVISSANIQDRHLERLFEFVQSFPVDWMKFQPVFDDGYINSAAPHLLLESQHAEILRTAGKHIARQIIPETNPDSFWESLAALLQGQALSGQNCGLDTRQAIAQKGTVKICSWIDKAIYDLPCKTVAETRTEFVAAKTCCKTGLHCYCLQKLSHTWNTPAYP